MSAGRIWCQQAGETEGKKESTSILRPSTIVPFSFSRARSASALVSNVTKPKPWRPTERSRGEEKERKELGAHDREKEERENYKREREFKQHRQTHQKQKAEFVYIKMYTVHTVVPSQNLQKIWTHVNEFMFFTTVKTFWSQASCISSEKKVDA